MNYTARWMSYDRTNAFSSLAIDYINQQESLAQFQQHTPDIKGIKAAINERKQYSTNRILLVNTLKEQYKKVFASEKVNANIEQLSSPNTFTVCTAHQPNLFTGYLYFVYKILHAVKLAEELNQSFPEYKFVPVYYMGSEDNDLEELNHINLNGDTLLWPTAQTGAVGRMNTKGIADLITRIEGQLNILAFGPHLSALLKKCYFESSTVQEATFKLVHHLFEKYGLVILIPDEPNLKREMVQVFEDDLFEHVPATIVKQTAQKLSEQYHAQVNPREINLFYMKDNIRERIIEEDGLFIVNNTNTSFTKEAIQEELNAYPERFSPNVVLRGLYQETLLPNIAFIGGGSEVAYWLELKDMFVHYKVPFPVLLLRNSFLIVEEKMTKLIHKLDIGIEALFDDESSIIATIIKKQSHLQLTLEKELNQLTLLYQQIKNITAPIDITLSRHVDALEKKSENALQNLEKKMMRAEKRKHGEQSIQLKKLKSGLFPNNNLQERVENILPYYARYGSAFIDMIYRHSPTLEAKFGVLIEDN
ncbi:MAG: bacillithiol biosynthesis cysteine-adding enzyme BshC [Agriterribacter sp.]